MAEDDFVVDEQPSRDSVGQITVAVVVSCIIVAAGGLIFGYDVAISGGVTTMIPFQQNFFPSTLRRKANGKTSLYCNYDSQVLTAFTSSLYIAGLPASLITSRLTANFGRKFAIMLGGCISLLGAAINGGAANIALLILGRVITGFGLGFISQAAPIYLSEVAPPNWRGGFSSGFEIFINVGLVSANCINYGMAKLIWGWRLSLGLAFIPAMIITLEALMIDDTPSSLINRGKLNQVKKALAKV